VDLQARHDDVERAIEAVASILAPIVAKLRRVRLVALVAAVVLTLAFWGGELDDGGPQAVAGVLTLGFALVPAAALTFLARSLHGAVDDARGIAGALRTWTDGDARQARLAEVRRQAAEVRAAAGLHRQALAGLGLVRQLHRTAGGVSAVRTSPPALLATGYAWLMALGVGLLGTVLVGWAAVLTVVLRLTGAIG